MPVGQRHRLRRDILDPIGVGQPQSVIHHGGNRNLQAAQDFPRILQKFSGRVRGGHFFEQPLLVLGQRFDGGGEFAVVGVP